MHRIGIRQRLTALFIGMGLLLSVGGCAPASDSADANKSAGAKGTTPEKSETYHGRVAIFTPADGLTISQHTPANKWGAFVSELTDALEEQGVQSKDIKSSSANDAARQSRAVQDYVVERINDIAEGKTGDDASDTTLVVAPVTERDAATRQYGDYVSQNAEGSRSAGEEDSDTQSADDGAGNVDDEAQTRLVAALELAKRNGMHVVLMSNEVEGVSPDAFVRMSSAEQIGRIQATKLVGKLQLAKASTGNPKAVEIMLPYATGEDESEDQASRDFAKQAFAGAWSVLRPYFQQGKAYSPSGLLDGENEEDDWLNVAFEAHKTDQVTAELDKRLKPDDEGGNPARIDGILALNDFVASGVTDQLAKMGYQGSAADINPSITISDIVGSIAGKRDLKRNSVPDPIRSPENDPSVQNGVNGDDESPETGDAETADIPWDHWPLVTGFGGYLDILPSVVEGKQWMTALEDRKTLAADTAAVCNALNLGKSLNTLDQLSRTKVAGKSTPTVTADILAVSASNLKTALIDPGYITPADAGL